MQRSKPHYRIRLEDAIEAHDIALTYGGIPGILNQGQLEAAIGRPYIGYHRRIHSKAAALTESLCLNHAFADGNKRTCFSLVLLFLYRSDYKLVPSTAKSAALELEDLIVEVAKGAMSFDDIEQWFKDRIRRK